MHARTRRSVDHPFRHVRTGPTALKRGRHFVPNGDLVGSPGYAPNRPLWASGPIWAARLFVGFNVGEDVGYEMDDLIEVVSAIRREQGHPPDASFVAQRGMYTSKKSGKTVTEDGAQVIVLDTEEIGEDAFEADMLDLADGIARELEQEEVIVEIQKGGAVKKVIGVAPGPG